MIEFLHDLPNKTYIGLFVSSLLASYWLLPRITWLARGFRLVAKTRSQRDYDTPTLGGLALGIPFIIGISLILLLGNQTSDNLYMVPLQIRGMFFGACGILLLGAMEDIFSLPRLIRLPLQIAIAATAYHYRFRTGLTQIADIDLGPYADIVFTVIWIVGLIYLFNLLQRYFRLFPLLILALTFILLGLAFSLNYFRTIMVCCLLSGGLLGYISHDQTTRPVLGSTGSYFIGFILAVTTLQSGITSSLLSILLIGVTIAILTLLLTLKSPLHLPFALTKKKQNNLYLKSLHNYRLASILRLQIATTAEQSWDALSMSAREFGYSAMWLQGNRGEVIGQWETPDDPLNEKSTFAMKRSGGTLHLGYNTPSDATVIPLRHAHFSLIVEEFDRWRENQILTEIARRDSPHRALLINRYYRGMAATGQLIEELAEDLHRSGINVTVLTGDLGYESQTAQPGRNELADGVHIYRVPATQFGRSTFLNQIMDFSFFYILSLGWILKTPANRYSHILCFTDPPLIAVIGYVAQRIKGWKFIYSIQDLFPDNTIALGHMRKGSIFSFLQKINKQLIRQSHYTVAISKPMEAYICKQADGKIPVRRISNWADGDKIKSARDQSLLTELGLDKVYTVIYAGNMGHPQGLDILVKVLINCKNWRNIQFLFVGGGAKRHLIAEAIASHAIGNARLVDYQRKIDLYQFFAVSDIGIVSLMPGLEGLALPSKTYSYFAAGLPILSIGAEHSELQTYADLGLGAHFTPDNLAAILAFLKREAENGSSFSHLDIRQNFETMFARPISTGQYADLIKTT